MNVKEKVDGLVRNVFNWEERMNLRVYYSLFGFHGHPTFSELGRLKQSRIMTQKIYKNEQYCLSPFYLKKFSIREIF